MLSFTKKTFSKRAAAILGFAALFIFAVQANAQTGGVKGKVRDRSDRGIAGAVVEVRQNNEVVKSARANSKGEFVISGLKSGKYNVAFDADGYSTGVLFAVEVRDGIRDLGNRLILSVDPGSLVMIRGSVFYREGTSVAGAKVDLEKIGENGSVKKVGTVYTNISGDFAFRQPQGGGKYRVTAKFKGVSGSNEITVDNAAIYRTAITLDISRTEK